MAREFGRISGPLLKSNLQRNGNNLAFETNLLYLDVINGRVGIKSTGPTKAFFVNSQIQTTNLLVDNLISLPNIEISGNTISTLTGTLNINATTTISASALGFDNIKVNNGRFSTILPNSDLNIDPTNILRITGNAEVVGDVRATGNITFDGSVTFGDSDTDAIVFNAPINTSINPKVVPPGTTSLYSLGNTNKRWNLFPSFTITGLTLTADNLTTTTVKGFAARWSNTWFVGKNGSNANVGKNPAGPFASVKYALSQAQAGDTIIIYPGTYTEEFPLSIPKGVSVVGSDIRTVIIQPTSGTNNKDCFLMDGETLVSDLTIRDFFYDSLNDTGYAFRFKQGFITTTRSPYVLNITVITSGSVTSQSDPRGFLQGDAGRGALVDGAVADVTSVEASMLFMSVTFITPNADGLTMKNGVRVEWLNSFTYFANRGLYALRGSQGRAGQGTIWGAELRSIGSANVYGNYGAVADGNLTIMYLIQHNFAYIGTGADSSNDDSLYIEANEVVELNLGVIRYVSQTHQGDFRVGDAFTVDQQTGTINIDTAQLAVNNLNNLFLQGNLSSLLVAATNIDIGDFKLSGNTIETFTKDFNINAQSNVINFLENVEATDNINITGNFSTEGTVTVGNEPLDIVTFNTRFSQSVLPAANNTYDLGSTDKSWKDAYIYLSDIGQVSIGSNHITSNVTNSNLELAGSGSGFVKFESFRLRDDQISITTANSEFRITPYNPFVISTEDLEFLITEEGAFFQTYDPGLSNDVVINSNKAVKIPTTSVTLDTTGELRFNPLSGNYEGFYNTGLVTFGKLISQDKRSSVSVDPIDNYFNLNTDSTTRVKIEETQTTVQHLSLIDGITIDNNVIFGQLNEDVRLIVQGADLLTEEDENLVTEDEEQLVLSSPGVDVESYSIAENNFNIPFDQNLIIGGGAVRVNFSASPAILLPAGDSSNRPTNPIIGSTRYNSQAQPQAGLETWDGNIWMPAGGTQPTASQEYIDQEVLIWTIVLG